MGKFHIHQTSLRLQIILAFAAVYLIWGSTYLAIRFAIETLPPFLMAGMRFTIAGAAMYIWIRLRGTPAPTLAHWRSAAVIGALLLCLGNGGVVWAEKQVPSSLAALLIAITPFWMVLLDWMRPGGVRPTKEVIAGLTLGLTGVVLLIGPAELGGVGDVNLVGAGIILLASLSWSIGSLYARQAPLPASPLMTTALEMLAGGVLLLLVGLLNGELQRVSLSTISLRSMLGFGYLIIFGSLVAFTAYSWLLQRTTPARLSTYAYVNPVVAVLLGWGLAGEEVTTRTLVAATIIVAGVMIITTFRSRLQLPRPQQSETGTLSCADVGQLKREA